MFYKYCYSWAFVLVCCLQGVPQIVHNVKSGYFVEFEPYYLIGLLSLRPLLVVYYRGFSDGFF